MDSHTEVSEGRVRHDGGLALAVEAAEVAARVRSNGALDDEVLQQSRILPAQERTLQTRHLLRGDHMHMQTTIVMQRITKKISRRNVPGYVPRLESAL